MVDTMGYSSRNGNGIGRITGLRPSARGSTRNLSLKRRLGITMGTNPRESAHDHSVQGEDTVSEIVIDPPERHDLDEEKIRAKSRAYARKRSTNPWLVLAAASVLVAIAIGVSLLIRAA